MAEIAIVIGGLVAFIALCGVVMIIAQRESIRTIRQEPTEHGPFS
jgi:hypothetical protein